LGGYVISAANAAWQQTRIDTSPHALASVKAGAVDGRKTQNGLASQNAPKNFEISPRGKS
jgi:hypothetical protein